MFIIIFSDLLYQFSACLHRNCSTFIPVYPYVYVYTRDNVHDEIQAGVLKLHSGVYSAILFYV